MFHNLSTHCLKKKLRNIKTAAPYKVFGRRHGGFRCGKPSIVKPWAIMTGRLETNCGQAMFLFDTFNENETPNKTKEQALSAAYNVALVMLKHYY